ncbi:MAG: STAS domain-containing protein [bacterium]
MDLKIDIKEQGNNAVIINLAGEMDIFTSSKFSEIVDVLLRHGKNKLIANLELVNFIDSAGLGSLEVGLEQSRKNQGDLRLIYSSSRENKLLKLSGYKEKFIIYQSEEDALKDNLVQ